MEYIDPNEYRIAQLVPAPAGWRVYDEDGQGSMPVACFALMASVKVNQQFVAPMISTPDGLIPSRLRAVPADEREYVVYSLTDQAIAEMEERERRDGYCLRTSRAPCFSQCCSSDRGIIHTPPGARLAGMVPA